MTNENAIEEAAHAIFAADYPDIGWGTLSESAREQRRKQARSAFVVFERNRAIEELLTLGEDGLPQPQGEPSDSQVNAAQFALAHSGHSVYSKDGMRVALRAAGVVTSHGVPAIRLIQAETLRDFAADVRARWHPGTCQWVGALDDEAARIENASDV